MLRKWINRLTNLQTKLSLRELELANEKTELVKEKDIQVLVSLWKTFQKSKNHKYDKLYNVSIYASIVGSDISYLSHRFLVSSNVGEKSVLGRLLSMTIIEFLDDILELMGKDLRNELLKNGYDNHIIELKEVSKKFANLRKANEKELRVIRNNAAAHKNKNALDLLDFTKKTELNEIYTLANKIKIINTEFTRFTTKVIYSIIESQKLEGEKLEAESNKVKQDIRELNRKLALKKRKRK